MSKKEITGAEIKQTLNALFNSFSQQRYQEGVDFLATLHPDTPAAFERMLQGLRLGDSNALAQLQRIQQLPETAIAGQVEHRHPHLSPEQHQQLTTFLRYYTEVERTANQWFCTIEGHACSADRSRALRRMLLRYFTNGTPPSPDYCQKYTYHLSNGSLVHAEEILSWYQHFLALKQGDLVPYALALAEGLERYKQRKHQTDLPMARTPVWHRDLSGKPAFVIRASLQHHVPDFSDPDLRIMVIQFDGSFNELSKIFHAKAAEALQNSLLDWALKDLPLQIPKSLRKYFPDTADVMRYLKARVAAMGDDPTEYRALIAQFQQIKTGAAS